MTGDELRASFLHFFEEKGHKIAPSSSLIPQGDPTLLLTTAGMVQFKPYFLGKGVPPGSRLASCQKCFRTTDIESVGDATHLTFFEMLGNFSIGDYFKREAIGWAWEFVIQRLSLPLERLWITIFTDDDEAFDIWRETGVPETKIRRFGEKDNFWGPAGSSGPCGPCSEIHFDFGEEFGCSKPSCGPNCDCGRFSEIWNLVFVQYNQDEDGRRTLLSNPSIDTGMGLERIAAVVQGKSSVYETGFFIPLLGRISELAGKGYGVDKESDNAMRIIAEHSRGIAFLIADGVIPGNEGRGYVLRRLLRRAALFGRRLGLDKPFLAEMAKTTIEQMGHVYPELMQRRGFVTRVVELEEVRFEETLSTGLERIESIIGGVEAREAKEISGTDAFRLYDTYGFPVELTAEIAAGRGFSVDLDGFEKEMEKQRGRAKAAHKFDITPGESAGLEAELVLLETPFTGYHALEHKSHIVRLLVDNKFTETIREGQEAGVILESTPFYGEMGGQVGDTGQLCSLSGRFMVTDTIRMPPNIILHQGHVAEGSLTVGDVVVAEVDRERRLDIARNHTATHLLQYALRQVLGEHVQQRGSLVAPDRFRFDFSYPTAMTGEEIQQVQGIVNEKIRQNLLVYDEELPYKKALEEGAIALFDEKYGETVRVMKIGQPAVSAELCGGTHVTSSGEIGFFLIAGESSIGAGLRRIEAVTGRGAERYVSQCLSDLENIARQLDTEPDKVVDKAQSLSAELKDERKRVQSLERKLAEIDAKAIVEKAHLVGGITVLAARVDPTSIDNLRDMSDVLRNKLGNAVVVLGTVWEGKPVFVANTTLAGYDAGAIVRVAAAATGGSGGGKKTLAQGGGKDISKIDHALKEVEKYIEKLGSS